MDDGSICSHPSEADRVRVGKVTTALYSSLGIRVIVPISPPVLLHKLDPLLGVLKSCFSLKPGKILWTPSIYFATQLGNWASRGVELQWKFRRLLVRASEGGKRECGGESLPELINGGRRMWIWENPSPTSAPDSITRCMRPWLPPRPTRARQQRQRRQPLAGMKSSFADPEDHDEVGPGMKSRRVHPLPLPL
ncbi:hypothetical protein [Oryza sativa Japonica Group]|uniref:Uncharacterized protein n=2 Tax=Oryza sativa subsp. japonica TaxID=39947 RepID=Q5QN51_ORYSJ|nr:hypothetical protein [Oryza sativa Japonica Group]BAD73157.1 hypothetical protein [Oryza sativa Japonica Group]